MDESKAEEEKQTPRIIRRTGEDFPLFDPECQIREAISRDAGVLMFHMERIYLQAEGLTFPISIHVLSTRGKKYNVVTPFHPEEGHIIDQRDFNPQERETKIRELGKEVLETQEFLKDPLYLSVSLNPIETRTYDFSPEVRGLLERLRLQLFFPGSDPKIKPEEAGFRPSMAFEARIGKIFLDIGSIWFERFYPLDTGPLAAMPNPFDEGLFIHVPSDLKELQKIGARFVLLPKNNKENPMPTDKSGVPEVFKKAFGDRKDF